MHKDRANLVPCQSADPEVRRLAEVVHSQSAETVMVIGWPRDGGFSPCAIRRVAEAVLTLDAAAVVLRHGGMNDTVDPPAVMGLNPSRRGPPPLAPAQAMWP